MQQLLNWDRFLLLKINVDGTNSIFDWLMPAITDLNRNPWILLALIPLLIFWVWKSRWLAVKSILLILIAVAASDLFCYQVIKPLVHRQRPEVAGVSVISRSGHHSGDSFPSNHAANNFAAATMLYFLFEGWAALAFIYAIAICYSRVYVGVHYPLDVIAGAGIGTAWASVIWLLCKRWFQVRQKKTSANNASEVS